MINSPRVCVQVQSVYIESQSSPQEERYVFAYTVTIRNLGRTQVQLYRYWLITNGHGRETEVQGEGVVGEQPHIPVEAVNTNIPAARSLKRRWAPCRDIMR